MESVGDIPGWDQPAAEMFVADQFLLAETEKVLEVVLRLDVRVGSLVAQFVEVGVAEGFHCLQAVLGRVDHYLVDHAQQQLVRGGEDLHRERLTLFHSFFLMRGNLNSLMS